MSPKATTIDELKAAAKNRWIEILSSAGISSDILDGRGHPCPRCFGTDRFAAFRDVNETGGVNCRKCFDKGNDGLATLEWWMDCDFPSAMKWLADYLGMAYSGKHKTNGHAKPRGGDLERVALAKNCSPDGLRVFGAKQDRRNGSLCVRFPMYDEHGKQCSHHDIIASGKYQGLNKKGSPAGLFLPQMKDGTPRLPKPGEKWCLCEGVKDAAALHSLGFNACGLPRNEMSLKYARLFRGTQIIIIPDRDVAGENGANKTAAKLYGIASSVHIVTLPTEFKKSKGNDTRDVLKLKDGEQLLRQAIQDAVEWKPSDVDNRSVAVRKKNSLPEVLLPGYSQTISDTALQLGRLISVNRTHFHRGGTVVRLAKDDAEEVVLQPAKPVEIASDFEAVTSLAKWAKTKQGLEIEPATCSESSAKLVMAARPFVEALPQLRILSRCPVLIERDGKLIEVEGYDPESGVLATGNAVDNVPLDQVQKLLHAAIDGFRFATPADKSRALAAMITPAMVSGGVLGGRPPIDLGEADQS